MRYRFCLVVMLFIAFGGGLPAQTVPPVQTAPAAQATAHHEANFEAERDQANYLFLAGKTLEALPLYEDLCHQDPTISVFAERHAAGLFAKTGAMPEGPDRKAVREQALAELRRAQSLGDNSPYLQTLLSISKRSLPTAIVSGAPLTVGYTYAGTPEAQAIQKEAEAAFVNHEIDMAFRLYERAAVIDPKWYSPPLFAGDMCYRMKDTKNAGIWFQRAIDIDPDRDTAYRYWGDALYHAGDSVGAKVKYEQAVVAEPYADPAWIALRQWATVTKTPISRPDITRPDFTTPDGKLQVDPALTTETGDGHASWLVYQNARVAHGARTLKQPIAGGAYDANGQLTPKGYRHSLAEEAECLTAMLVERRHREAGKIGAFDQIASPASERRHARVLDSVWRLGRRHTVRLPGLSPAASRVARRVRRPLYSQSVRGTLSCSRESTKDWRGVGLRILVSGRRRLRRRGRRHNIQGASRAET